MSFSEEYERRRARIRHETTEALEAADKLDLDAITHHGNLNWPEEARIRGEAQAAERERLKQLGVRFDDDEAAE